MASDVDPTVSASDPRGETAAADRQFGSKFCVACYASIPKPAEKCVECGSAQNWQRYLTFSATILGLLVALVSVATFAVPIWRHAFYVPEPKPFIAYISTPEHFTVTISNAGDAPMILSSIWMTFEDRNGRTVYFKEEDPGAISIIKPNNIISKNFQVESDGDEIPDGHVFDTRDIELFFLNISNNDVKIKGCTIMGAFIEPSGSEKFATEKLSEHSCDTLANRLYIQMLDDEGNPPQKTTRHERSLTTNSH